MTEEVIIALKLLKDFIGNSLTEVYYHILSEIINGGALSL